MAFLLLSTTTIAPFGVDLRVADVVVVVGVLSDSVVVVGTLSVTGRTGTLVVDDGVVATVVVVVGCLVVVDGVERGKGVVVVVVVVVVGGVGVIGGGGGVRGTGRPARKKTHLDLMAVISIDVQPIISKLCMVAITGTTILVPYL